MKYESAYELAVNYVFGDTVVVSNDKVGFTLSNEGYRQSPLMAILYEPGAFESGYYRAPSTSQPLSKRKSVAET